MTASIATTVGTRRQPGWLAFGSQLTRRPLGFFGLIIVAILVLLAIFAPFVSPYTPDEQDVDSRLAGPSAQHIVGTDELGRDLMSRVIWGARVSLQVGFAAVLLGTLSGAFWGLISGYFGGWLDNLIQRIMDAVIAFPAIILAMALILVLGSSLENVILAIAIIITPGNSRIVRSAVLAVKENQYVEAARSLGAKDARVIFWHILPNVMAPILVLMSMYFGNAILIEASLSFLGLGVRPPTPSWGLMLNDSGRMYFETNPWIAIVPGVAISIAIMGFNLFGDALRDILDPRLRDSR